MKFMMTVQIMRFINKIIVHCSYTRPSQDIGVEDIRHWHVEENGWRDIGYHYVIRRDGSVETGRPITQAGAHTRGQNSSSIGICLVGGMSDDGMPDANFTVQQYQSLKSLIEFKHPNLAIFGHRDFSSKPCPCFDVRALLSEDSRDG